MDGREKETIFARQNIFSLMRCKSQVDNFGIGRTLWALLLLPVRVCLNRVESRRCINTRENDRAHFGSTNFFGKDFLSTFPAILI